MEQLDFKMLEFQLCLNILEDAETYSDGNWFYSLDREMVQLWLGHSSHHLCAFF